MENALNGTWETKLIKTTRYRVDTLQNYFSKWCNQR